MALPTEAIYAIGLGAIGLVFIVILALTSKKKPKPELKPEVPKEEPPKRMSEWGAFERPLQLTNTNTTTGSSSPSKLIPGGPDQSTATVKKMSFTLDTLIFATVMAGFLCFLYAYVNPNGAVLSIFLGSIMFIPVGMILGAMFSGSFRVKILRRITRRNYGYVRFLHSSRLIKTVVANLDNDVVKFGDGVYIVDKQNIKREGEDITSVEPIEESKIKFEEGVPTIYFDIGDIMPIDFAFRTKSQNAEEDKFRLPSQVSATLNKEIAVEKAKVMKAFRSQQNLFMIIMLAIMVLTLYFSYNIYTGSKNMISTMNDVSTNVNSLKTIITTVYQSSLNNITTVVTPK